MAGGDLRNALDRDLAEHGRRRRLGWYARGRVVLLCIARGLTYLHRERVRRRVGRVASPASHNACGQLRHCRQPSAVEPTAQKKGIHKYHKRQQLWLRWADIRRTSA